MKATNQIVTAQRTDTLEVQTTVETIILSSPTVTLPKVPIQVLVLGSFTITLAAGSGQSVKPRIRRGTTLAGTVIGTVLTQPEAGSSTFWFYAFGLDSFTSAAEPQYSLTVENVGATSNATVKGAAILVLTL
jgi:hypothetical protein